MVLLVECSLKTASADRGLLFTLFKDDIGWAGRTNGFLQLLAVFHVEIDCRSEELLRLPLRPLFKLDCIFSAGFGQTVFFSKPQENLSCLPICRSIAFARKRYAAGKRAGASLVGIGHAQLTLRSAYFKAFGAALHGMQIAGGFHAIDVVVIAHE